jgi:hypothetical protein
MEEGAEVGAMDQLINSDEEGTLTLELEWTALISVLLNQRGPGVARFRRGQGCCSRSKHVASFCAQLAECSLLIVSERWQLLGRQFWCKMQVQVCVD